MIGKLKLLLFATIFPSFGELPVTPFSGLPLPLLYDTSTFKVWEQLWENHSKVSQTLTDKKAFAIRKYDSTFYVGIG